ncbi:MAG: hypothetical protein MOGMAGMI_00172 [Candidatus Omnitrophica bacterium]|nr:hypothetical protein [Candidatus Omnitrophota bacterium]
MSAKPRIGISSCLLGQKVRYDGQHKHDAYLTKTLGPFVEWVAVCPEVEAGMGVPRPTVRLVGDAASPRMVEESSGRDWTETMTRWAAARVSELARMDLSGYVLKKDSPSCGMERVRVYARAGTAPRREGRGLFAAALMDRLPLLPVEEEGRLNDPPLRENFIERVFAYHRYRALLGSAPLTRSALVAYHAQEKFLIQAHHEPSLRLMGRLVAGLKGRDLRQAAQEYGRLYMGALARQATVRTHTNVLEHLFGFFSDRLDPSERRQVLEVIRQYHRRLVPLVVPVTLVRHFVRKYDITYLLGQSYLEPHPKELLLRNHA